LNAIFAVAVGGAAGSVARYLVVLGCARLCGPLFPWGTLAVNVAGSLVMGVVAALLFRFGALAETVRHLVMVGFLGGFTTFSSFSLDVFGLAQRGETAAAAGYLLASVILSVGGLLVGLRAAQWLAS
jgi:fluoride exporter